VRGRGGQSSVTAVAGSVGAGVRQKGAQGGVQWRSPPMPRHVVTLAAAATRGGSAPAVRSAAARVRCQRWCDAGVG